MNLTEMNEREREKGREERETGVCEWVGESERKGGSGAFGKERGRED